MFHSLFAGQCEYTYFNSFLLSRSFIHSFLSFHPLKQNTVCKIHPEGCMYHCIQIKYEVFAAVSSISSKRVNTSAEHSSLQKRDGRPRYRFGHMLDIGYQCAASSCEEASEEEYVSVAFVGVI